MTSRGVPAPRNTLGARVFLAAPTLRADLFWQFFPVAGNLIGPVAFMHRQFGATPADLAQKKATLWSR